MFCCVVAYQLRQKQPQSQKYPSPRLQALILLGREALSKNKYIAKLEYVLLISTVAGSNRRLHIVWNMHYCNLAGELLRKEMSRPFSHYLPQAHTYYLGCALLYSFLLQIAATPVAKKQGVQSSDSENQEKTELLLH